jgi:hypothetical protein
VEDDASRRRVAALALCEQAHAPWERHARSTEEALYRQALTMDPSCAHAHFSLA